MDKTNNKLQEFIKEYNPDAYEKPSVTTDTVIFTIGSKNSENKRLRNDKELQVLLIKRKNHPFIGQWALPGGFVQMDEGLLDGAKRELFEETGVRDVYLEQLYTWGDDVHRDPRMRIISVSYMALIEKSKQVVVANDDAEDAKWFSIKRDVVSTETVNPINNGDKNKLVQKTRYTLTSDDGEVVMYDVVRKIKRANATQHKTIELLPCDNVLPLAFDHHEIIDYAIERLASKISYTPIAFNLLPEKFTLTELQQVYEVILNEKLIMPNFRRKITPMVEEIDEYEEDVQRRPAKLHRYKFNWSSWE